MAETLAQALRRATARLERAGVPAAEADAVQLAGHLLGLQRGEVAARAIIGADAPEGLDELVERRAAREPLQHIVGTAPFRRLAIQVGPG